MTLLLDYVKFFIPAIFAPVPIRRQAVVVPMNIRTNRNPAHASSASNIVAISVF